jgi:opacity protein-like surface antigen
MRFFLSVFLLATTPVLVLANQFDFNLGRGTPLSSIQAGGSSDSAGSRGTEWSADLLHQTNGPLYLGLGGGMLRSNDNSSDTFVPGAHSTIRSRRSSILVLSRTDLGPPARMVPYLIAGIGWARNSLTVTAVPAGVWNDTGTSEQRTLMEESRNTVGYVTGIGLDYMMTSRIVIGIEGRYQGSIQRPFDLTPAGQAATGVSNIPTSLNSYTVGVKAGVKY